MTKTHQKLVVINLDFHLWSGNKKLRKEDLKNLGIDVDRLPPEALSSLGSKHICNPKELRTFQTLKRTAEKFCEEVGSGFLKGYTVPERDLPRVVEKLDKLVEEFNQAREVFLSRYDQIIQEWLESYSDYRHIIEPFITPKGDVAAQLTADYQMFRVADVSEVKGEYNARLHSAIGGLANTLFRETAKVANNLWKQSIESKSRFREGTLKQLSKLHTKLEGLSFLDSRIVPLAALIESQKESVVPENGWVTGESFYRIAGLVWMLKDEERLAEYANNIATTSPENVAEYLRLEGMLRVTGNRPNVTPATTAPTAAPKKVAAPTLAPLPDSGAFF